MAKKAKKSKSKGGDGAKAPKTVAPASTERMRPSRPAEVKKVRDDAIARAAASAGGDWMDEMETILIDVCKTKPWFSSDDVAALAAKRGIDPPSDLRAMGAVMKQGAANFLCEKQNDVNPVPSSRKSLHGSPRYVWRSLYLLKPQAEETRGRTKAIVDMVKTSILELID